MSTTDSAAAGALDLGEHDGTVERDHRARLHDHELVVQGEDLRPVGVARRATRPSARPRSQPGSDTARAGCGAGTRAPTSCPSAMSERSHSDRSWSASSTSEPSAATRAGRRASVSSNSASSPITSGSSGMSSASRRAKRTPPRTGRSRTSDVAAARGVPLVVDQVEDGEHGTQPVRQLSRLGHAVGDLSVADLALRPHDPLRHRRLGHEERTRDLLGLQAAEQAQRQRHLRARRQRRVAAREDHPQAVVAHGAHLLDRLVLRVQEHGLRLPVVA